MNTWVRKLGLSVLAVTLAGVLGGCDDNNGDLLRVFFGINGSGDCDKVTVTVDLNAADAVIVRDRQGTLDCVMNASLESAGCDLGLEVNDGVFVATIDGCTIPAVTNLLSCVFQTIDISAIQEVTTAQCDCNAEGCDIHPPICVSGDPDPTSCEDCTNGVDDDGNGLTDCNDPNCRHSEHCGNGSTTSTTTSSSSTTSTTESSTTTSSTVTTSTSTTSTTIPRRLDCMVTFRLNNDASVGALQWDTAYDSAPGAFVGTGGDVDCAALPEAGDVIFSANDKESQKVLTIGMTGVEGFTGPINIAQCRFKASVEPQASDYAITVVDASNPEGTPIVPLPPVVISNISCTGPTTTTTVPQTTTTTEVVVTTTTNTTTTTGQGPSLFAVTFSQTNNTTYGALQLGVDYSQAGGDFVGSGATVACTKIAAAGSSAYNDNDAQKKLGLGWISLDGSTGPQTLTVCDFQAASAPAPGDFQVTIEDATDVDFNPITVTVGVQVAPK